MICEFMTIIILISSIKSDQSSLPSIQKNVDKPIPILHVSALLNGKASLPCVISPPDLTDDVYLVLWYRDYSGKPLYSFDVRGRLEDNGKHWSASQPFGNRAFFKVESDPTFLLIDGIRIEDEGVYRCRVDYRDSPTRNIKVNLTVVVPPEAPQITMGVQVKEVNGAIGGPYNEEDKLYLSCNVAGGRPPPSVTWWMNDELIDSTYEIQEKTNKVVNELKEMTVKREMNKAVVECRATNHNVSQSLTRRIKIKVYMRPLNVEIDQKQEFLRIHKTVELYCQSYGSKPSALITWFLDNKAINGSHVKSRTEDELTISIYSYSPRLDDNGKSVICRAENPYMNNSAIQDVMILNIMYAPILHLRLGSSLNLKDIKEGDDIYFECTIEANPRIKKIRWMHNNLYLHHNVSGGIILSNWSLVLQQINKEHSGDYQCISHNNFGSGQSNLVNLQVQYRPVCSNRRPLVIGVGIGNNVSIQCQLLSNPVTYKYRWWFNSTGKASRDSSFVSSHHTNSIDESHSTIQYRPLSDLDYGTLSCYGLNSVGRQILPCNYQIIPISRPHPPENCTLKNSTSHSLILNCDPAFEPENGNGSGQIFVLEVYDSLTNRLMTNKTNPIFPLFRLDNFRNQNPITLKVYSVNERGQSEIIVYANIPVNKPEQSTVTTENDFDSWLMMYIIFGIGLLITFLSAILVVFLHQRHDLTLQFWTGASSNKDSPRLANNQNMNNSNSRVDNRDFYNGVQTKKTSSSFPHESLTQIEGNWYHNPIDELPVLLSQISSPSKSNQYAFNISDNIDYDNYDDITIRVPNPMKTLSSRTESEIYLTKGNRLLKSNITQRTFK